MDRRHSLLKTDARTPFPQAIRGDGVWIEDDKGRRYMDACSGALVANLGHGVPEIAEAMARQATQLPYLFRFHFTSEPAETLAHRYCHLSDDPMGAVYFVNSGSEANETAVKLARAFHLARKATGRYKIISRWQSYHGITMGALAWTGLTARRADYLPYLRESLHIPPCYCYRCWFGKERGACGLECAEALETALLSEGPETVAAFIAEPVVGTALSGVCPPEPYFSAIREICDRHGILYIADEVMTGAGRTGGRFFASDHFPGRPDIIAFGKGAGAGYYPLAGALVNPEIADTLNKGPGGFAASQSHAGHPPGMAAGMAILDYMEANDILARAAESGALLGCCLDRLADHPLVGEVRGRGMMWGLELVEDKATRRPFAPERLVNLQFYETARELGVILLPSGGCDHGVAGDMALVGPPLTISEAEIRQMCSLLEKALNQLAEQLD